MKNKNTQNTSSVRGNGEVLLSVKNLNKTFKSGKNIVKANNDVSFDVYQGEVVGLIGESGSGKTTIGRTIMNLHSADSGSIKLNDIELAGKRLTKQQKKYLYNNIQMIFQDPYSSLNEQKNIMSIVSESLEAKKLDKVLYEEYIKHNEDIIYYFENELKEAYFDKYWKYRISSNDIAIEGLKKIINNLEGFKINPDKTITSNFKRFENNTYEIKSVANYEIIDNLDHLLQFTIDKWREKQRAFEAGDFEFEDEKELSSLRRQISKIEAEINASTETRKLEEKILELENKKIELESEIKHEIINTKINIKKTIANVKYNIGQVRHNQASADSIELMNKYNLLIEKEQAKIIALKEAIKFKKSVNISKLIKLIEKQFANEYKNVSKDEIKVEPNVSKEQIIDKTREFIDSEINVDGNILKLTIVSNELNELDEKLKKATKIDKERDLSTLKEKLNEKKDEEKVAIKNFEDNLVGYRQESKELMADLESKSTQVIDEKVKEILTLRKKVMTLEKETLNSILKLDKYNPEEYKSLQAARKNIKNGYKKMISDNNKLEQEIKVNMKALTTLLQIYKINNKSNILFKKTKLKKAIVRQEVFDTLEKVGLNKAASYRYPHEFSGGMRQRVGIARALISRPKLIIADEPIAALDLSIQAQIVNLLLELKEKENISLLFIAHDLSMIEHNSDNVVIMHLGKIVEHGQAEKIFKNPIHSYTKNLMNSIPSFADLTEDFKDRTFVPEYLKSYSGFVKPEYIKVEERHWVLAIKKQFTDWTKNEKKTKKVKETAKKTSVTKTKSKKVSKLKVESHSTKKTPKPAVKKTVAKTIVKKTAVNKTPIKKAVSTNKIVSKKVSIVKREHSVNNTNYIDESLTKKDNDRLDINLPRKTRLRNQKIKMLKSKNKLRKRLSLKLKANNDK